MTGTGSEPGTSTWSHRTPATPHPHPLLPLYIVLSASFTNTWSALTLQFDLCYLFMRTPHQGSKRKQGSFFVGLLSLIIEEGGQRVHAFNTICKCSARPKLTLVPPDLSSTFLGMRWYTEKRNGPPEGFILTQAFLTHTHAHAHTYVHARNPQRGVITPLSTYGRTDMGSNFLKYWLARVKEKVINERWPSSPLHGFSSRGTFSSINPPNCLNIALSAQPSRRPEPRSAKCRPWSGTRSSVLRVSAFSEFFNWFPGNLSHPRQSGSALRQNTTSVFHVEELHEVPISSGKICFATVPVVLLCIQHLIHVLGGQWVFLFHMFSFLLNHKKEKKRANAA